MPFFLDTNTMRPNRLTDTKNEEYHCQMGRWTLNSFNNPEYRNFIIKTLVNWSFYKGGDGQWILDEDLDAFFLDESGDPRNRLKVVKNLISPMVRQYIGNTVRLAYNARAKTTSDFVINKRERELNKTKFYYQVGNAIPEFKPIIADHVPSMGDTEAETVELFDSMFDDNFAETINNLLSYVEQEVNMEDIKIRLATNLALSGLNIYKGFEQNGEYCATDVDPLFFIRDFSAVKPDLSDSEFMGEWYYKDVPSVFEKWQNIKPKDRTLIETWSQRQSMDMHRYVNEFYLSTNGKVPIYETYWRDTEQQEYGYVEDEYGYPMFVRINHEESKYKDKDLVKPPKQEKQIVPEGQKKTKIFVDVLRYCIFIPREEIGSSSDRDIVLEWGELPYQEKTRLKPSSVAFPYKCYTWVYDKGHIVSPIDDAINPQRFINRMLSVSESHINNARGTGTIIAGSAVNGRDGEETMLRDMNRSKPVFVDVDRVGSVGNAIGTYGSGINSSINNIYNVAREMQQSLGEMTGVNESMTGTQGAADVLVGVVQAQIAKGSLVQENFYYALTSVLKQAYQHIATVGKRIYRDNPRRAAIALGDGGYQMLEITQDMVNEDFRVFIERTEAEPTAIANANNLIFTLVQAGMLDSFRASMLFNRANMDQVAKAMREYQIETKQAQIDQSKLQQQRAINQQGQEQQMAQQQQSQQQQGQQLALEMDDRQKQHELNLEETRGNKKIENTLASSMLQGSGRPPAE